LRDRWKNLKDRFGLSIHLKKHWPTPRTTVACESSNCREWRCENRHSSYSLWVLALLYLHSDPHLSLTWTWVSDCRDVTDALVREGDHTQKNDAKPI